MNSVILNHQQIKHKIKRIAYQIYEANADETTIYIAGIAENGFTLAKKIASQLKKISDLEVQTIEVFIDKKNILQPVKSNIDLETLENQPLVLIDDVLNTGGVLIYCVKYFLEVPLKKFLTAVLVDRNHKKYPVKVDFKGISLSTGISERVDIVFEKDNDRAILNI